MSPAEGTNGYPQWLLVYQNTGWPPGSFRTTSTWYTFQSRCYHLGCFCSSLSLGVLSSLWAPLPHAIPSITLLFCQLSCQHSIFPSHSPHPSPSSSLLLLPLYWPYSVYYFLSLLRILFYLSSLQSTPSPNHAMQLSFSHFRTSPGAGTVGGERRGGVKSHKFFLGGGGVPLHSEFIVWFFFSLNGLLFQAIIHIKLCHVLSKLSLERPIVMQLEGRHPHRLPQGPSDGRTHHY